MDKFEPPLRCPDGPLCRESCPAGDCWRLQTRGDMRQEDGKRVMTTEKTTRELLMARSERRPLVADEYLEDARARIEHMLRRRLDQRGRGSFASRHEILGIVTEEYHELIEAIHGNEEHEQVVGELVDIAVACLFGVASMEAGTNDW